MASASQVVYRGRAQLSVGEDEGLKADQSERHLKMSAAMPRKITVMSAMIMR